jgi:hypothetical protein
MVHWEVKLCGHSHVTNEHYYRKVEGTWKFAGLKLTVRWNEGRFEAAFKGSYKKGEVVAPKRLNGMH